MSLSDINNNSNIKNNLNDLDDELIINYLKEKMEIYNVNKSIILLPKNILYDNDDNKNIEHQKFKIIDIDTNLDNKLIINVNNDPSNNNLQNKSISDYINAIDNVEDLINCYLENLVSLITKGDICNKIKSDINGKNIISNINHNFKTRLNGLALGIQILDDSLKSKYHNEIINNLFESCIELTKYVNDIIDYYMLVNNKVKFENKSCNISMNIARTINNYEATIKENNIKINEKINIDNTLFTDITRLNQVLDNLIYNSIKFTNNKIDINVWNDGDIYFFNIKDDGDGITLEDKKHIFKPFYQCEKDIDVIDGLGLGLTLSKMIIEKLGGGIELISCDDEFNILFTIKSNYKLSEETQTNKLTSNSLHNINSSYNTYYNNNNNSVDNRINSSLVLGADVPLVNDKKILIIEDNIINSNLLKLMIEKSFKGNINVINNSIKALDEIKNNNYYDIIFLDIRMPKVSGYDILKEINKQNPKLIHNVYIITALLSEEINDKLNSYKLAGIISKPIQMEKLKDILKLKKLHSS